VKEKFKEISVMMWIYEELEFRFSALGILFLVDIMIIVTSVRH
jgi:hypothetical protein